MTREGPQQREGAGRPPGPGATVPTLDPAAPGGKDGLVDDVPALGELAEEATRLAARLQGCESSPVEILRDDFAPAILALARRALARLGAIAARFDRQEGAQTIVDLIFVAHSEVQRRLRGVASPLPDAIETAARLEGLLRAVKRAACAVQSSLCERAGLAVASGPDGDELALALEVRQAYARLRRDIERVAATRPPGDAGVRSSLLGASTCLARLVGADVFRKLRVRDRAHVLSLQTRVVAWCAAGSDLTAGRRLWEDFYCFTQLVQEVNRRQELFEHDRRLLDGLGAGVRPEDEPALRGLAAQLASRDGGLEALLDGNASAAEIAERLQRLGHALGTLGRAVDGPSRVG